MKYWKHKSHIMIVIAILVVSALSLAGGCARTPAYIPGAIKLEPPPIMITAEQLYAEYMADEAAADAKYKGKGIWVIEAIVASYQESESGNYLMIRWYQPGLGLRGIDIERGVPADFMPLRGYCLSTVKLEPQSSEGFKDLGENGYVVEIVGEWQGISEGVVTLKINRIAKTGVFNPEAPVGY